MRSGTPSAASSSRPCAAIPSPHALSRGKSARSSSSTRASGRAWTAASAAADPAGPPPTTTRSHVSSLTARSLPRPCVAYPLPCRPVQTLVVDHPLAAARLTTLRDERTDNTNFRVALRELSSMLIYEATRELPVEPVPVTTPVGPAVGARPVNPPLLVPVLRAGLGMAEAALGLLPESQMGFVGLARDERTFQPRAYLEPLPDSLAGRPVLVLDPMLATGGSLLHCCRLLTDRGCQQITVVCVLVAPEGQRALAGSGLPLRLVTAAIDDKLNDKAYIVPGLGDAGDRQFGAV